MEKKTQYAVMRLGKWYIPPKWAILNKYWTHARALRRAEDLGAKIGTENVKVIKRTVQFSEWSDL